MDFNLISNAYASIFLNTFRAYTLDEEYLPQLAAMLKFNLNIQLEINTVLNPLVLHQNNVKKIAHHLNVPDYEVIDMNRRLSGADTSLNSPALLADDSDYEKQDFLIDETPNQELMIVEKDERLFQKNLISQALSQMPKRDREIIIRRRIEDPPATLETLSHEYGISRERIRQIEDRSFKNLKKLILKLANPKITHQLEYKS
jgi:RNA polymerase sigma-32 factor